MANDVKGQAGNEGRPDGGPVSIIWIKIIPNKDTVLNVPDPVTTRRVYFGAATTDDPPELVFGYFTYDVNFVNFVTILAESIDDPTKLVDLTLGHGEAISMAFHNTYHVITMASPPPFSVNDELQSHVHVHIEKLDRHT